MSMNDGMNEQVPGHVTTWPSRAYRSAVPTSHICPSFSVPRIQRCTDQGHVFWQLVPEERQPAAYQRQTRLTTNQIGERPITGTTLTHVVVLQKYMQSQTGDAMVKYQKADILNA